MKILEFDKRENFNFSSVKKYPPLLPGPHHPRNLVETTEIFLNLGVFDLKLFNILQEKKVLINIRGEKFIKISRKERFFFFFQWPNKLFPFFEGSRELEIYIT